MRRFSITILAFLAITIMLAGCGENTADTNKPTKGKAETSSAPSTKSKQPITDKARKAMYYINDRPDKANGKVFNGGDMDSMKIKCVKGDGVDKGVPGSRIDHQFYCMYYKQGSETGNFACVATRDDGTVKEIEFDDSFDMPVFIIQYDADGKVTNLIEH